MSRRLLAAAAALAAALVLGPALWAAAQPLLRSEGAAPTDDPLVFAHYTADEDLPSSTVLAVAQDAFGFIWVGTDGGLTRLDGLNAVTYLGSRDSTALPSSIVTALAPLADGDLWVGTKDGLAFFDSRTERFRRVRGTGDVLAVVGDSLGGAWAGTEEGLFRVPPGGRTATPVDGLPDPTVRALHLSGDGALWVGTADGLVHRPADGGALRVFRPDSLTDVASFDVAALAPTSDGGLLVGTFGEGLFRFAPETGAFTALPLGPGLSGPTRLVSAVLEDASGNVWAGTLLAGGLRQIGADGEVRVYEPDAEDPGSISDAEVSSLLLDRQGILWVGTYDGLDRADRSRGAVVRLRHSDDPSSLASNDVLAVLAVDSTLYAGTDQSLDVSTDGRTFRHLTLEAAPLGPSAVLALHRDERGTVWVGTRSAELFRLVDGRPERVPLPDDDGGRQVVRALAHDPAGRFWVGTERGLFLLDRDTGRSRSLGAASDGLASDRVSALAVDARGVLWVGTDAGLCSVDLGGSGVRCFRADPSDATALNDDAILALHARPDGSLWVGTAYGLHRLDARAPRDGFTRYLADGTDLPDDAVRAIIEDDAGHLWLSTGNGITRFEPVTGVFDQPLGTQSTDRMLTGAADRAPDGRLYFGTSQGLLAAYPGSSSKERNPTPPQVAITGVQVNGQPVRPGSGPVLAMAAPHADRITLGPDDTYLKIQYAGLHFSNPERNTFRHRLLGSAYDAWDSVATNTEATYTTLDPGTYTFQVEAANADGIGFESGARAEIAVVVRPPWWRTWWALLTFAVLAVAGLVRADRWQRARLLRQERERADRREAELRAETAEAEQRKATAEAAALKAENDRKAAELERAREVEAANARLEASLRDLQATQAQLVQSEKLASLGQLTAGIAHEIKNPLNFVNNFADLSVELAAELREEMEETPDKPAAAVLDEVGGLLDDLQENCRRIREHGQRADRIVRAMLLHSRGGSAERGQVVVNRFVEEYANLAFHGARANDADFHVEIVQDFGEDAGEVEVVPQEFGRVLINLLTNAFHAVQKKAQAAPAGYAPTVTVRTRREADWVVVEVEDNGTGIPDDVKARIFEPFFTTKKTGEGTGLGLSLAHDIVTGVHGGRMSVESTEGEGTTFRVELPTAPPAPAEA